MAGLSVSAKQFVEKIKQAMPNEMYRVFTHYKGDEWARFNATVNEWDVQRYLDCLP